MIQIINKFIHKEQLFGANSKILLAVSGGMDSMCLLDVLYKLKYDIAIAHLNHQLRSNESDEDEDFVIAHCQNYGINCHTKKVDVQSIAEQNKRNISDIGREERYNFFSALCLEFGYTHIATAHHSDDDIETFLMRSMDGSGLTGLAGIPVKNNNIVRPLLNTSRQDIEDYMNIEQLSYREDSSNESTKYMRNAIRKMVIPEIEKIKHSSKKGIKQSIDILKDSNKLFMLLVQKQIISRTQTHLDKDVIDLADLHIDGKTTFIYHIVKQYGFNRSQAIDITTATEAGKYFHSQSHTILYDREQMIITPVDNSKPLESRYSIPRIGRYDVGHGSSFHIEHISKAVFNSDSREEIFDADRISFPLTIRLWQSGDSFSPIGMNGQSQSLQDFFTNQKLSRAAKQKVWIIESNHEIIWVVGHRLSESIKVTAKTKQLLRIRFTQQ